MAEGMVDLRVENPLPDGKGCFGVVVPSDLTEEDFNLLELLEMNRRVLLKVAEKPAPGESGTG